MKTVQLEIQLKNSGITRVLEIPSDISFATLHEAIQISLNWSGELFYSFYLHNKTIEITNDEVVFKKYQKNSMRFQDKILTKKQDPYGEIARSLQTKILDSQKESIANYLSDSLTFEYLYDFADNWDFRVKVKAILPLSCESIKVLSVIELAPVENCGGLKEYQELLTIFNDVHHPEHEQATQWAKEQGYGPCSTKEINDKLGQLLVLK